MGLKIATTPLEKYLAVSTNAKQTFTLCSSAIPLLGIYPTEASAYVHQKMCKKMFTAALSIIAPK